MSKLGKGVGRLFNNKSLLLEARDVLLDLISYAEDCAAQNDERPAALEKARALLAKLEAE